MLNLTDKALCSGCSACKHVCPVGAIIMRADTEGCLYPQLDASKCIRCGKCQKVCPVQKPIENHSLRYAIGAKIKDEPIRLASSSGGIFSAIATYVLSQNGIVFGATLNKNLKVRHIAISSKDELFLLQGSKYVQSELLETYNAVKTYLQQDKLVLFTGTPCQVQGLYAFLGKEYVNLLTQDFICHGVVAPVVFKKYIENVEQKENSAIERLAFRDKSMGWKKYSIALEYKNGATVTQPFAENYYMKAFLSDLSLRPACYRCAFKGLDRISDITVADFWGIENVAPTLDDGMGTSLVIVHTKKGLDVLEKIKANVEYQEVDLQNAVAYNPSMLRSPAIHKNRKKFFKDIVKKDFDKTVVKYTKPPLLIRIKRVVKKLLHKI